MIFLPLIFYVKSISEETLIQKVLFLAFLEPLIFESSKFQPIKNAKFPLTLNSEPLKMKKWQFLNLWKLKI